MKNAVRCSLALALVAVLVPSLAFARWHSHGPSNMRIEVPDDWRVVSRRGDTMSLAAPAGGLSLALIGVANATQANVSGPAVTRVIDERLENVRRSEPAPFRQHGLTGELIRGGGNAREGGAQMEFVLMAIHDDQGRGLIVFGIAPRGNLDPLRPILDTVRPAR